MYENHDSLVEIAIKEMQKKRKPRSLNAIAKEVFEIKGLTGAEAKEQIAQFQIDFMLCGNFICCGEDRKGEKLWDLKTRQPSSLLDKEGIYLEDKYDDDEDVVKNELKDDTFENENGESDDDYELDDDDDDVEENDDIEEELMLYEEDSDDEDDSFDDDDSEIQYKRK